MWFLLHRARVRPHSWKEFVKPPIFFILSRAQRVRRVPVRLMARIIDFFPMQISASESRKENFLEHAQVHGDHYGTLREPIVTNLETGRDVLIDIDTQGAAVIRNCGDPLIRDALADVFIMPPDLEELRKRLLKRGTETAQQIDSRLATAAREMEHWRDYRYTIISGSVEEDLQKFRQIMEAESYLSRRLIEK